MLLESEIDKGIIAVADEIYAAEDQKQHMPAVKMRNAHSAVLQLSEKLPHREHAYHRQREIKRCFDYTRVSRQYGKRVTQRFFCLILKAVVHKAFQSQYFKLLSIAVFILIDDLRKKERTNKPCRKQGKYGKDKR